MSRKIFLGRKKLEYYDGLLIRADPGLHEQISEIVSTQLDKGAKILDMGAGQGALSARLYDLGYSITAADTNDDDYSVSGRDIDYQHINFDDEGDIKRFVDENESKFDCVCGVEVIEHVENPWAYVRSLTKLVKKGGLILITTPNITSWLSRISFLREGKFMCFKEENLSYGHINPVSKFELELIMNRSGLYNVRTFSGGTLPPLYFSGIKLTLFSLLALVIRPLQFGILNGWCVISIGRK